jgi:hypothetical protein
MNKLCETNAIAAQLLSFSNSTMALFALCLSCSKLMEFFAGVALRFLQRAFLFNN